MAGRVLLRHWRHGNTRYSLTRAGVNAEVVEAFDINDNANKVHQHNFGHRPYQGNIQSLTAADLDCLGWMHDFFLLLANFTLDKKQSGNARAFSFLNILELIPHTSRPPMVLFVENVVGFETSDTHTKMIEILGRTNFVLQEFILSLLQFGVPYSRPRYFFLAKRKPSTFYNQVFYNQLLRWLGPLFGDANADETVFSELDEPQESRDTLLEYCEPIESFLEFKNCSDQSESNFVGTTTGSTNTEGILKKDEGSGFCSGIVDQYIVPLSFGREPKNKDKASSLKEQHLRYFIPREVANLYSLPEDFQFPQHIFLRQHYALLGNSLSVVAPLLKILICRIIVIILKTPKCSRCRSHPQLYVWLTISTTNLKLLSPGISANSNM